MGKPTGFLEFKRGDWEKRKPEERVHDYKEYALIPDTAKLQTQGARCMECGVPFCNWGCPIGNLIPEWNDLIYKNQWEEAIRRLHKTNNFPEFTGRVCPAPCENSCVLGIIDDPVSIKLIEQSIVDRAYNEGYIKPNPPQTRTGKKVAVIGSGPAGLAAADQLNKAGHTVTVMERADRIGGLLRYGIPDFKLDKNVVQRRIDIMAAEGVTFKTSCNVGYDVKGDALMKEFDAICLCGGATQARDLKVPGRELQGVFYAMEFLPYNNKLVAGDKLPPRPELMATGKKVVIIGGGDTGADCLGTSHRQGAKGVIQLELLPEPPKQRAANNPWPQWAFIKRKSGAHEEGGEVMYAVSTKRLEGNGKVERLIAEKVTWEKGPDGRQMMKPVEGSEFVIECDLVLLAMGFLGPEKPGLLEQLKVQITDRGNVWTDDNRMTSVPKVFAAGDLRRGQSLVVWAINEGRTAAHHIDKYLMGSTTLPIYG